MTIISGDFQRFRARQRHAYRLAWLAVTAVSVAGFFVLGDAWSYVAGLVWMVVLPLISYDGLKQWNRRRWRKRFPELADMSFGGAQIKPVLLLRTPTRS